MSKWRLFPLVLLVAFVCYKYVPRPDTNIQPDWIPTPAQQESVAQVRSILQSNPDAAGELSKMFWAISEVVESDNRVLKSTEDVQQIYKSAGSLAVQRGQVAPVPGLPQAIEAYLAATIGDTVEPLSTDKRAKVAAAFKTLSWAAK